MMVALVCIIPTQLTATDVSNVGTLASQCGAGKHKACSELAKIAVEDKDASVRSAAVAQLTDQAVLAKVALGDENASVRAAAVAKLTDQSLRAKIAVEDKDAGVRCSALPLDPLVQELRNRAMQGVQWFPPFPPALLAQSDVTARVKEWQNGESQDANGPPPPQLSGQFTVEGTSVFMLEREGDAFMASCEIPATDGKIATGGAIWQERNQDVTTGRMLSASPAISGVIWTPRTTVIGKLDLTGPGDITSSPNFDFDAFKNAPGVIPFANGYAVNLFGQKLKEQGLVDPDARPRGNYVTDDGKPLYGRLVRNRSGKLEEIALRP